MVLGKARPVQRGAASRILQEQIRRTIRHQLRHHFHVTVASRVHERGDAIVRGDIRICAAALAMREGEMDMVRR